MNNTYRSVQKKMESAFFLPTQKQNASLLIRRKITSFSGVRDRILSNSYVTNGYRDEHDSYTKKCFWSEGEGNKTAKIDRPLNGIQGNFVQITLGGNRKPNHCRTRRDVPGDNQHSYRVRLQFKWRTTPRARLSIVNDKR